jgi:hypothetical protein
MGEGYRLEECMAKAELGVLLDQLDEMLDGDIVDGDDAVEIAWVAGLARRLGANSAEMAAVEAWRLGPGGPLLEEGWQELEVDAFVQAIDGVVTGEATDEQIEEAVLDFDELVAGALWCGQEQRVRSACRDVAETIRSAPEVFAPVSDLAKDTARLPTVAEHFGLYDFLFALCDAG